MVETFTLAFSSCPNDTFIFDAIVNKRIDTEGVNFQCYIEDVESLNQKAFKTTYDISKMSFHAFFYHINNYMALTSGSALCDNFGPVLIAKKKYHTHEYKNLRLAVPGLYTSAALLYKHFFTSKATEPFLFSEIEKIITNERCELGIIIHENVFTYKELGLLELANLGSLWQTKYNLPVPLGCIAVKRSLPEIIQQKINRIIKKSIEYAFENPQTSYNFVKQNAVNLSDNIIKKHIMTYVNTYSLELDAKAKKAIALMFESIDNKQLNTNALLAFYVKE